ncbi:MAG: methyltransferase domain-containing protein [Clostridia bacterium]|nr:methyltransferase domain-containing protein [Clostridia bacterium]
MNKEYWRIKEVSELYNINANKLRFYEKKGLISPLRDSENGYRKYSRDDLAQIQMILTYRLLELSVEDIRTLLQSEDKASMMHQILNQLTLLNTRINRYQIIQKHLNEVLDGCMDSDTRSDVLNYIIEAGKSIGSAIDYSEGWQDQWDFDAWAEDYDLTMQSESDILHLFDNYDMVLEKVFVKAKENLDDKGRILEIGVGTGVLAAKFLDEGLSIMGVDQSHQMLLVAKRKYPALKLRVGDFMKLPFGDGVFDRIVSTYAFHHLKDEEKAYALTEMLRVLKPSGYIVIGDMMFMNPKGRQEFLKALDRADRSAVEEEYYTDVASFGALIEKHNLDYEVEAVDALLHILTIRHTKFVVWNNREYKK